MDDPRKTLSFALEKYPDQVEIAPVDQLVMEAARQNPRRPAYLKMAVPDEMVKNLRGTASQRDLVLLVRVPRELGERSASPIVLPHEVE